MNKLVSWLFSAKAIAEPVGTDSAVELLGPAAIRATDSTDATPLSVRPAKEHATRLIAWLHGDTTGSRIADAECFSGPILARDLQRQYAEMAAELNWCEQPWRRVGRELALMISGGKKTWERVSDSSGSRHRLRVYVIPPPRLASVTPLRRRPTPEKPSNDERIAA
jgi:hypothetical protein